MREWSIEIYIVGPNDELMPATCFEKVTYRLHESFGKRATQRTPLPPIFELWACHSQRMPC